MASDKKIEQSTIQVEEDNVEYKTKLKRKTVFKLFPYQKLYNLKKKDLISYIKRLHKLIKSQDNRLKYHKNNSIRLRSRILSLSRQVTNAEVENITKQTDAQDNDPLKFIEEIKYAAEIAQNQTDFVYEPTSGLYYDCKTGYYYNAEMGLYYDGNTGCYYSYNQTKNEFEFHSQVQTETETKDEIVFVSSDDQDSKSPQSSHSTTKQKRRHRKNKRHKKRKSKKRSRKRKRRYYDDDDDDDDREDGEVSSSDSRDSADEDEIYEDKRYEDIAKKYPPSLRIIVQETNLEKLKIGTLFLVTYKGGSLGREGVHDVIIPDLNVSKFHLKFVYNESKSVYQCIDLGSRNGTILNGIRMSCSLKESEPFNLIHGSILQISETKLLCHIHDGNATCGHCEPGLIKVSSESKKPTTDQVISHKEQLKLIQKKYGLENEKYVESKTDKNYKDRAATRRKVVGSSDGHEKTEMASLETSIPSSNKGFKMLSKLGWSEGQTLGKSDTAILEPIPVRSNEGKRGLGSDSITVSVDKKTERKNSLWRKTQQRYNKIEKNDIFKDSDDDANNSD